MKIDYNINVSRIGNTDISTYIGENDDGEKVFILEILFRSTGTERHLHRNMTIEALLKASDHERLIKAYVETIAAEMDAPDHTRDFCETRAVRDFNHYLKNRVREAMFPEQEDSPTLKGKEQ